MLLLKNVYKNYFIGKEEISVLKNINLEIKQGEFVAIVGASGCGKTTLLNLIAGMDQMTAGSMETNSQNCAHFKEKQWALWRRNHIGYIFQNFNLIEFMTAKQNIELVLRLNGMGKRERNERADELLEMVGLSERANHRPSELSGGQKQRVAIARALANTPDIILADEPTGAVDSITAQEIIELLKKINREQNVTVIMVTHDDKFADQAERKILMRDGVIIHDVVKGQKELVNRQIKKDSTREMSYGASLKVAYKNIATKKKRTILTALGTAIGIAGVMLVLGIGAGAKGKLLGEIGNFINNQVVNIEIENNEEKSNDVWNALMQKEGVVHIYPNYSANAILQYEENIIEGFVEEIAPLAYITPYWEDNLKEGRMPVSDDCFEILITESLAQQLYGQNYTNVLGKQVSIVFKARTDKAIAQQIEKTFTIVGIWGKNVFGTERFCIPSKTLEGMAKQSLGSEEVVASNYEIIISDERYLIPIKEAAEQMGLKASIDRELIIGLGTVVDMITAIITLFAGISLVVSGIMISLVTYMGVLERTREIGILKAVGFTNTNIKSIFSSEGAIVGMLAGIIGISFAASLGNTINSIFNAIYQEMAFKLYTIDMKQIVFCLIISTILGHVCSHSAAKKAAKMEPVKALGYVA